MLNMSYKKMPETLEEVQRKGRCREHRDVKEREAADWKESSCTEKAFGCCFLTFFNICCCRCFGALAYVCYLCDCRNEENEHLFDKCDAKPTDMTSVETGSNGSSKFSNLRY